MPNGGGGPLGSALVHVALAGSYHHTWSPPWRKNTRLGVGTYSSTSPNPPLADGTAVGRRSHLPVRTSYSHGPWSLATSFRFSPSHVIRRSPRALSQYPPEHGMNRNRRRSAS